MYPKNFPFRNFEWQIHIFALLSELKKLGMDIIITTNGLALEEKNRNT